MTRSSIAKRALPWWHLGLQLTTVLAAIAIVAIAIQFARNEWLAVQSLRAFFSQQPDKISVGILSKALGSNRNRESAELQGRISDEARSPYLQAQIHNLLLVASDEPEDLWWKSQEIERGVRGEFVGWETNPEMLTRFIEEQRQLLTSIHRWCDDDEPALFPPNQELGVIARLLYLECEDAIQRSDPERVLQSVHSLGRLSRKFERFRETFAIDQFSQSIYCVALHRALDKQLLPLSEWELIQEQLRKSLYGFEQYELFQQAQRVAAIKKDFDACVDLGSLWTHALPSINWKRLHYKQTGSFRNEWDGFPGWFALPGRYAQSVILRLAALRFIEATGKLPEEANDLDPYGATAAVWTDLLEGNAWKYRRTDSGGGTISLSRAPSRVLGAEFRFPATMVFEPKTQPVPDSQ